MNESFARRSAVAAAVTVSLIASAVRAVDIAGVEPAALDQPRINAYISRTAGGAPLTASEAGIDSFNIQAYYDTGASGVLLSTNTAALLGLQPSTYNGQEVIYSDVGVAGSDQFYVSDAIHISLADFHPNRDVDNPANYSTVYTNHFGPVRAQIGPANSDPDPALGDLDVFGMPTMAGKVVVMDPKPVNSFLDTMRTYVYAPGTPYNASSANSNPGIPNVDKHVKLSYVNFDRFTQVTPAGAPGPSLRNNPFIGPNPFVAPGTDATPPITLSFAGKTTTGSFLLDTGAAASIISNNKAGQLGVSYDPDTIDSDSPVLLYNGQPIQDQFQLTIGGIGGSKVVSGFYLSSLLLKTEEGNASNNNDPNHLRFTDAPVLVSDISVQNPNVPNDHYTLDGIFGMNFLVASASIAGVDESGFPLIGSLVRGKFDWVTFDEPNGRLGLTVAATTPQDQLTWFGDLNNPDHSVWDKYQEDEEGNVLEYGTANWLTGDSFGIYEDGDNVYFGDLTFAPTVRLNIAVAPGSVLFENNLDEDGEFGTDYDLVGTGKITGFGGLTKRGTADLNVRIANDYKGATLVEEGRVLFFRGQNIGPVAVSAGAEVILATSETQRFESISVAGSFIADGSSRIVTKALAVPAGGHFELNDAKLIVGDAEGSLAGASATAESIRQVLASGGLVSSVTAANSRLSIGFIEAALKFNATGSGTWNGEVVGGGQVLVAVTRKGDADLDLVVNFNDLVKLAQHYNQSGQTWSDGDFDYNGIVNFNDLVTVAQNYGGVRSIEIGDLGGANFAADWALAQSLVPEPSIALALLAVALPGRRRSPRLEARRKRQLELDDLQSSLCR